MMMTFMDAMLYAMEGENPSKAIENQERRGQQSVVRNQRLPKKLNDHSVPREVRWNGVEDSMEWEERNRIVTQTINFVAIFVAAGGQLVDALDYQISTKILRKVITSDDEEALFELQEAVTDYPETTRLIEKRLKELR